MMTVIKVLAALVVLAVLGGTAWLVNELRTEATVPQLSVDPGADADVMEVEPGERAFESAVEFLAVGDFDKAKEKLEFVVGLYPGSASAAEARRILGELNLDELLSTDSMEGKSIYKVVPGDAYASIARKHETTIDCIMHLNGLQRMDRLYPGDELVVMELNFNVKVDVPRKRLSLMSEGRFLKSYSLLDVRVKPGAKGVLRTVVKQKSGYKEGRMVPEVKLEEYGSSSKVLSLASGGLQIREVPGAEEDDPGFGFFLSEADIEELALLLRAGNEVEVRFTTQ